jgi:glycosyltransferase involved in cell wall biosynthesis
VDKKINIAQVIYGLKYGGAEKLLIPLSTKVDSERFRVMVIALTCGGPLEEQLRRSNIDVRVLRRDGRFSLFDLFRLVRLIKEQEIDIIHTHLQNADIWAGLAAKFCGVKHISTFHGVYFKISILESMKQKLRVILPHKIIAVSHHTANYCIVQLKAKSEKVVVVHNGVDISKFQSVLDIDFKRRELGIAQDKTVLASFGRLEIEKGHRCLIEAIAHLKNVYSKINLVVLIVGEGSLKQKLMKMSMELGLNEIVRFLGDRRDVAELLEITDIVVNPSLSEGLPLSCLEAMAAGKPVVATRVGGMPELIKDKENGLLVESGDPARLARGILDLIEDKDLAKRLALKAKDSTRTDFSIDKMLVQTSQLYESLINSV